MDLIHDLGTILDVVLKFLSILIALYTILCWSFVKGLWEKIKKQNRRDTTSGDFADRDE